MGLADSLFPLCPVVWLNGCKSGTKHVSVLFTCVCPDTGAFRHLFLPDVFPFKEKSMTRFNGGWLIITPMLRDIVTFFRLSAQTREV